MNINLQKIFTDLPGKQANLILLVLASQHIDAHAEKRNDRFDILVNPAQAKNAQAAVTEYHKENRYLKIKQQIEQIALSSFSSVPTFIIMGILCFIHAFGKYYHLHESMVLSYGSSALFILQGETYRAVTALFLHADLQHLMGNMAGLLIFGAPVIQISGYGTGPFMLLFCGTTGNLINAHLYQNAHLSIGASTAVMAAAGLLCAFQALRKDRTKKLNTIMPIFAGALLVALFSQGENTDVWAHIFGFISGLAFGLPFFPLNRTIFSPKKDPIALFITICILLSALLSSSFKNFQGG